MTAFYTVLKIVALLAIIILPLFGPKKKKTKSTGGLSRLAVNGGGFLEPITGEPAKQHPVN
ncbi:hypothetical protein [Mucilaginibacter xinganensis]|uniref:Uncharacterized protein n=1 Tax=Mucilaginibacter xinganensis TaxID=1234841 RepID=A0A223NQ54_9SPHI|nr:hypothetical protein [Mucilaginibacter xinganensis]ASU32003.1 hypothetical protein MuYL_0100 [Mucilaginibacter xinganensis]